MFFAISGKNLVLIPIAFRFCCYFSIHLMYYHKRISCNWPKQQRMKAQDVANFITKHVHVAHCLHKFMLQKQGWAEI